MIMHILMKIINFKNTLRLQFLFDLNNVEGFSLSVGRQVNNLVNLSVERKLYICCLLISLYNFLSGSCEVDCQGDEKYASLKDYIHLTIISLAI